MTNSNGSFYSRVTLALRRRFSLSTDKADDDYIDRSIRSNVEMVGSNLWILMFAIIIASVGLNVNSTAVIIGAMLVSPLMGPIMGIGYGIGIYDIALIQKSLKNLGIAALISLFVSSVYFLVSPIGAPQSELLARTMPTIWDVLIALFGGLAGIVAATRKERTTVISGVAIATALMPPLCTAGYGVAIMNWHYFIGAFYLFAINSVFIAATSAIVVKAFHVPHKAFNNYRAASRARFFLGVVVVITVIPSVYLTLQLLGDELFRSRAVRFVHENLAFKNSQVVDISSDPHTRSIEVTLVGDIIPLSTLSDITGRLTKEGLKGAELKVFQAGNQNIDVSALKSTIILDLYKASHAELLNMDETIKSLRSELASMKGDRQRFIKIPAELNALYPMIDGVLLSEAPYWNIRTGWSNQITAVANVMPLRQLADADRAKIIQWLRLRLHSDFIKLIISQ